MKKILIMISSVFFAFFVSIDVKANCNCITENVDGNQQVPYSVRSESGHYLGSLEVLIKRNNNESEWQYQVKWKEVGEYDEDLGIYVESIDKANVSSLFRPRIEGGSFKGPNGGQLGFVLEFKGSESIIHDNDAVLCQNNCYSFTCTCDGVNENKIENQTAPSVVDDNGNVTKNCKYYIVDDGTDNKNMSDEIEIIISNNDVSSNSNISFTGIDGNNIKNMFLADGGTCLGTIYVTRDTNKIVLSSVNNVMYTYNEKRKITNANYSSRDSEPETSPLWPGIAGTQTCDALDNVNEILQEYILKPMRYLVPIIFLIMTSFDFAKSVFGDDKSGIGKAKKNLIIRIVVSILVFFVPNIVEMLFNLFKLTC